jgi:hypothetical protein
MCAQMLQYTHGFNYVQGESLQCGNPNEHEYWLLCECKSFQENKMLQLEQSRKWYSKTSLIWISEAQDSPKKKLR